MPAAKSPAKPSADVLIKGPTGPSWDAVRALAEGKKGDAAAAASQAKSFLSNPALPLLVGSTAAAVAKLAAKVVAGAPAAVYKEVLALSDAAVAKLSGGSAPAGGKKVLDVAALVAELCVSAGTAFAPDAIEALKAAAAQEAKGKKPAKKAAKKSTAKVRFPPQTTRACFAASPPPPTHTLFWFTRAPTYIIAAPLPTGPPG
jgi:hypothetical protein